MALRVRGISGPVDVIAALDTLFGARRSRPDEHDAHARRQVQRVIAARAADGGVRPIARVIPRGDGGRGDAAASARVWPPALLNPTAHLRTAWDLALGRPGAREILFTFDDGPKPGTTDRLLDILDRHQVKAVFFVCGWRLETDSEPTRGRARAILLDAYRRGHVIGNHSITHPNMANLSPERIAREVEHNSEIIEGVIGQRPHLFRPPYGSYSDDVQRHVQEHGYELSLWSIDSHDWQMVGDAEGVAMNVIRLIGNMAGGTVLLHDTHAWSVRAADMVLRWIKTENRERGDAGRPLYRVVDAAEFYDGARERLPMIQAQRDAEDARSRRRRGGSDAGAVDASATTDAGAPSDNRSAGAYGPGAGPGSGEAPGEREGAHRDAGSGG
ncbi:MAG: polysaccharide deacetylase family protein [Myxococcales bacterium]|nr:polysaccharide deacetylase family protein [Myxococcales bacterium]